MKADLELEHDGDKVEDALAKLARLGAVLPDTLARGRHVSDSWDQNVSSNQE